VDFPPYAILIPMYERHIMPVLQAALRRSPVVFLSGARQVGKSTLVQQFLPNYRYILLDDQANLELARRDPKGLIEAYGKNLVIDEVQVAPELLTPIKHEVDRNQGAGRFVLTGSANILVLPSLSESLAGRMEILRLYPLSQGEIEGKPEEFIDWLFGDNRVMVQPLPRPDVITLVLRGGFPRSVTRKAEDRPSWFASYLESVFAKDVRDLSNIRGLVTLPNLMALLAARNASLFNVAELSRSSTLPQSTLTDYLHLLEALFLIRRVPAWSSNLGKRLVKTPKLYMLDSGLAASLLNVDAERLQREPTLFGGLLENFVVMELFKQLTWSKTRAHLYHFRTHTGQEVDIVLEGPAGDVVGLEVKNKVSISAKDFKGLEALKELTGKKFKRGVLFYMGENLLPFGENIWAVPLSGLWELR
jgi:uncharacterized protein